VTRSAILFANLRSGRATALQQTVESLGGAGIKIDSAFFDLDTDTLRSAIERCPARGIDLVLAFGGDGTMGTVAEAMVGTDLTLGAIAGGTSNNFVRSLGITPSIQRCIEALRQGRVTRIDMGEVNGRYFAHAAIVGLNVEFARQAQRYRRFVGRASYPVASLMVYRSRRKLSLTISQNGTDRHIDTYQLAVLNSGILGGPLGVEISQAEVTDRKLRVATVDDMRLRTVVRDLPRIFFERHLGLPGGEQFDLVDGDITSTSPLDITLDGEIKAHTPARICIVPRALRVIVAQRTTNS
jgi:diacylglycerol kinase (ATP)